MRRRPGSAQLVDGGLPIWCSWAVPPGRHRWSVVHAFLFSPHVARTSNTGPARFEWCDIRPAQRARPHAKPGQRIFVGVIDPIDPRVETAEEVRDRVLEAAEYIPLAQLGTTDDCGFSPFSDDTSTARETAFAKIRGRVLGTELASRELEG